MPDRNFALHYMSVVTLIQK